MSRLSKRKFLYSLIVVLPVFILLVVFIVPPIVNKQSTCFDNKKNGEELGVDCGGGCALVCPFEVSDPVVLWSRVFPAGPESFHALAYLENRNKNVAAINVDYTFELRDNKNRLISYRQGQTFIPPHGRTAVFESWISGSKNREPARTVFKIKPISNWIKVNGDAYANLPIIVQKKDLQNFDTNPKLYVRLKNKSILSVSDFDVIAILYDESNNAIQIGKSYVEEISPESTQDLFFTWPEPLSVSPNYIEIILRINPLKLEKSV